MVFWGGARQLLMSPRACMGFNGGDPGGAGGARCSARWQAELSCVRGRRRLRGPWGQELPAAAFRFWEI